MHQAGKTDEARQDLARLALVRQQREEAARKREEMAKSKIDSLLSKYWYHIYHILCTGAK